MKKRILFADDEDHIRKLVKLNLEAEGYHVTAVDNGLDVLRRFSEAHHDLVILDVMMPELDGISVCENIRVQDNKIPILFLSARGNGEDRVAGLKSGGDDYLPKPFNLEELLLRVKKLIDRSEISENKKVDEYSFGKNYINFESFEATGVNGKFKMTKKEAQFLKLLIEHEGEVVTREKILNSVWGYAVYPNSRSIDNFILSFRKNFEKDPSNPKYFLSLRGVGYKFNLK